MSDVEERVSTVMKKNPWLSRLWKDERQFLKESLVQFARAEREQALEEAFELTLQHREKARKRVMDGHIVRPLDFENLSREIHALKSKEG